MPVLRENVKSITIRVPVSLFEELQGEAKDNRRSLNQQIIYILEQRGEKNITTFVANVMPPYNWSTNTPNVEGVSNDNPD